MGHKARNRKKCNSRVGKLPSSPHSPGISDKIALHPPHLTLSSVPGENYPPGFTLHGSSNNYAEYQQRIKTSIPGINTSQGGSGNVMSNYGLGATSGAYSSCLDPSLSPNVVMQPNPGPINVPPNILRPVFQFLPQVPQDRRLVLGKIPMCGGMDVGIVQPMAMGFATGIPDYHPPIHDPSEFPSLTSLNWSLNEVGVGNSFTLEGNPFEMSSDDFPALPGAAALALHTAAGARPKTMPKFPPSISQYSEPAETRNAFVPGNSSDAKPGIFTTLDGKVTNIPSRMINDQFGMAGLLTRFRAAETNPDLVSLALGTDLTELGLNLNASDRLYSNFGGPWAEGPVPAEDMEFAVPHEYRIGEQLRHPVFVKSSVREKLAPVRFASYKDDLLFYIFYNYCGDILQMLAAAELYERDWRYHKEEKVWITRIPLPGVQVFEKNSEFERGTYYFFNPISWTKIAKELCVEYDKLEGHPFDVQSRPSKAK